MAEVKDSLLQWDDDEKTIIRIRWQGAWSWDVYYEFHERVFEMMRSVDHPVYLIYDVSQITDVGEGAMTHFRNMAKRFPDNLAGQVVVGPNEFLKAIGQMYNQMMPEEAERLQLFTSVEDAHAALKAN